jgi:hypothetical protein
MPNYNPQDIAYLLRMQTGSAVTPQELIRMQAGSAMNPQEIMRMRTGSAMTPQEIQSMQAVPMPSAGGVDLNNPYSNVPPVPMTGTRIPDPNNPIANMQPVPMPTTNKSRKSQLEEVAKQMQDLMRTR